MTAADLIRGAKLRRDEFRFCTDPDLVTAYEDAQTRLADAAARDAQKFSGGSAAAVQAEIDGLLDEMAEATVTLVLQALPRRRYRELVHEHPPRKDADGKIARRDEVANVDYDGFFNALARACILGADDGDGGVEELPADVVDLLIEEQLSDGQWDELTTKCNVLNRVTVDVPFSPASSPSRRHSSAS